MLSRLHQLWRRGDCPKAASVFLQKGASPERLGLVDFDSDQGSTVIQLLFGRVDHLCRQDVRQLRFLIDDRGTERLRAAMFENKLQRQVGSVAVVVCSHERLSKNAGLFVLRLYLQPGNVQLMEATANPRSRLTQELVSIPIARHLARQLQAAIGQLDLQRVAVNRMMSTRLACQHVIPPAFGFRPWIVDLPLPPHICGTPPQHALPAAGVSPLMEAPGVTPPRILPDTIDRRLYRLIHGLPHTPISDRYVTVVSDLGEGLGWVAAGIALAWLGGRRGRRAGLATAVASLGTTYLVQDLIKPRFRRTRPWVGRDVMVVGIRTTDASFPSGHTASSFAAATALSVYYPKAAPLSFLLAAGVGVSRVHLGHHFPSDVAVGSVIGLVTGAVTAWVVKKVT